MSNINKAEVEYRVDGVLNVFANVITNLITNLVKENVIEENISEISRVMILEELVYSAPMKDKISNIQM
jgi:hypothetical protein